jgi:hypothetical protein|tara:strand:+ start:223 stop:1719 length:1497 start_codon:yes stop_codon:yes gene_type:complete
MAFLPLDIKPGIKTNGTDYQNKGNWIDADLVRFENGFLTNIGGWRKLKTTPLDGTPISAYAYTTNNSKPVLAIGTRRKIYVLYNEIWYNITPTGYVDDTQNSPLGYGAYQYGMETYGDARSQSGLAFNTKPISFDNFGENLIICSGSDGKVYQWQPSSPSALATQISNSPTGVEGILVSNERHIFCFGNGTDKKQIRWSSREAPTVWTPASTNTAGDLNVTTGGNIIGGVRYGSEILVFTDVGLQKVYYTGAPLLYGIQEAGKNCRATSMRTVVSTGNFVSWLGDNSFYIYDGQVRRIPSDVHDYVFDNINYTYRTTSCGGHNQLFNEIWWFFPSGDSKVPNKYIIWNYMDNNWSIGSLDRSMWLDQGVMDYPIACDSDGNVYEHESNNIITSPNIGNSVPFATTGAIEIAQGDRLAQVNKIIPDSESVNVPGVTLSFKGRQTPLGAEEDFGSFAFNNSGYQDCRFSARQVNMKVTGDTSQDFKVGNVRLDVRARGRR